MNATQLKKGKVITLDGELYVVLSTTHITPGNWRGYVQIVARNLATGAKINKRVRSTDKIDDAFIETQPGSRGDTVTNVQKAATVETGLVVKVPLFIEEGESVRVDTRTGEFIERVKQ